MRFIRKENIVSRFLWYKVVGFYGLNEDKMAIKHELHLGRDLYKSTKNRKRRKRLENIAIGVQKRSD